MRNISLALTLIKGPNVKGWAREIGDLIDALHSINDNIPVLWEQFLDQFRQQF
jgi:hypothetical protein